MIEVERSHSACITLTSGQHGPHARGPLSSNRRRTWLYARAMPDPSYVEADQRLKTWSAIVPIVVVTLAGLAVIWLIAVPVGPEACGLAYPGPRNCFVSQREAAALLPTIVMVLLAAVSAGICVVWTRFARAVRWVGAA